MKLYVLEVASIQDPDLRTLMGVVDSPEKASEFSKSLEGKGYICFISVFDEGIPKVADISKKESSRWSKRKKK